MRPLTLHVSALSDAEYDLYTTSLDDLATNIDTHDYEPKSVGVREARAWLRGRYSDLPGSDIDTILKLFCPHMLPSDALTGGQFFAALRLVVHAESGKGVDRTLAFVQASPRPTKTIDHPRPRSPPKRHVQAPPSHPDRQKPPLPVSSPETNPFTRRSIENFAAPTADPTPAPALPQKRPGKLSHNPFLARDRPPEADPANPKLPPLPPRKPPSIAARRASDVLPAPSTPTPSAVTYPNPLSPPLIPAKPTHVMSPLMRQSLEASKHAQSMKRAEAQLDRERVLQVLKTTSTSSGSSGNTIIAGRTRSLSPAKQPQRVINGSVPVPVPRSASASDDATYVPPLPRRHKTSQPSSASSSALSLEQVAHATLPSPTTGTAPVSRPPLPSRDHDVHPQTQTDPPTGSIPIPPPTHPHRRASTSGDPTTAMTDVRPSPPSPHMARPDLGASSSSTLPPPPPRRRQRPESMQLTPTTDAGDPPDFPFVFPPRSHARATSYHHHPGQPTPGAGLSRHLSLTRDRGATESSASASASRIANLRETFVNLQHKAQPKLDAVRYKAEAGISRRGYVHGIGVGPREEGELGLMAESRCTVDRGLHSESESESESETTRTDEEGEGESGRATTKVDRHGRESDNLKWPMGVGWKPL